MTTLEHLPGEFTRLSPPHVPCTVSPPLGGDWCGEIVAHSPSAFYPIVRCTDAGEAHAIVVGQLYLVRSDFIET